MKSISDKVKKSKQIISKAVKQYGFDGIAIAWKGGKDTTTMMHMIYAMYGRIPFRVMFNDTTLEFPETYEFIERVKKLWNLDLIVIRHTKKELEKYHTEESDAEKKNILYHAKIHAIQRGLKKYKFKAFMLGIRKDEHEARKSETAFSPRDDHMRIHPMLDFTEKDIWDYIRANNVPYSKLYDKGYRSVGEKPLTKKSTGKDERAGRDKQKEEKMEKLRQMGYW
jgi:phosphoadenosine phosphosulfate reductase